MSGNVVAIEPYRSSHGAAIAKIEALEAEIEDLKRELNGKAEIIKTTDKSSRHTVKRLVRRRARRVIRQKCSTLRQRSRQRWKLFWFIQWLKRNIKIIAGANNRIMLYAPRLNFEYESIGRFCVYGCFTEVRGSKGWNWHRFRNIIFELGIDVDEFIETVEGNIAEYIEANPVK